MALLAGAPATAYGAARFLLVGDAPPPGVEGLCSVLDAAPHAQAWASDSELAATDALVVLMRRPDAAQSAALRALGGHLATRPLAPPVLLVPLGAAEDGRGWIRELIADCIVDAVVDGEPQGHALAFALRAKMWGLKRKSDRLQEDIAISMARADEKERILETIHSTRWQYIRSRLFRSIPPSRDDVEEPDDGTVAGLRLGRRISQGAFGTVRAAHRTASGGQGPFLGMLVIEKTGGGVRSISDMGLLSSFLAAVQALTVQAPHASVARTVDIFSAPKRLYVAMELLGPQTLFARLRLRDAPAPGATPLAVPALGLQTVLGQVAAALRHMHLVANVCHRDVKPENVSVCDHADGRIDAKLFGFDLAEVQPEGRRCKRPCGTMPFAAPEIMLSGRDGYDGKAADMWSLGVLCLEVACGLRSVERALPALRAKGALLPGGQDRRAPPAAAVAVEVQNALRGGDFARGLLRKCVPEAAPLVTWLTPALIGLLHVDARKRISAADLQPVSPHQAGSARGH